MNAVTVGVSKEIENGNVLVMKFAALAAIRLQKGKEPSMIVGRPGALGMGFEDRGRTLIIPFPKDTPKLYAVLNETGGVTVMLADEY